MTYVMGDQFMEREVIFNQSVLASFAVDVNMTKLHCNPRWSVVVWDASSSRGLGC